MRENTRPAIIKIYIGDELKARIKATASLHNMTFTELIMDALYEKYPHIRMNGQRTRKQKLEEQLATVLYHLSHSAELTEEQRTELKNRKNYLKEEIRKRDELEAEEEDIFDFVRRATAEIKKIDLPVIQLSEEDLK